MLPTIYIVGGAVLCVALVVALWSISPILGGGAAGYMLFKTLA